MLRSAIKTTILLGALTGLLVLIGGVVGGRGGAVFAFFIALVMNFFSYWFSDKMVLKAYNAQEIDAAAAPELYSIVQELAQEAHIQVPRMYLIDTDTPNAFATGRNPHHAAVAVTRGILRICSRDELKGVLGHELSHVINRDILTSSIAATLAGAIMILGAMGRDFWRLRRRRRRRPARRDGRAAADGVSGATCGDHDPARSISHARVPGRRQRSPSHPSSALPCQCAAQAGGRQRAHADGRRAGDRPSVYRQSADGTAGPHEQALFNPSAARRAHPPPRAHGEDRGGLGRW